MTEAPPVLEFPDAPPLLELPGNAKINKKQNKEYKYQERLYVECLLEMNVALYPTQIGQQKTKDNLLKTIADKIEGKCIREGYVQPKSVVVQTYSCGIVKSDFVEFTVVFKCYVSNPAEGTNIRCKIKSITKAGIHAHAHDMAGNIPVTVFVARDHFVEHPSFQKCKEEEEIYIKVIGSRFELNDESIEALGELIQQ